MHTHLAGCFSPLYAFEIEENNLLARNGCIAVAIVTRDIVVKRVHTTAGNKGLKFFALISYKKEGLKAL